MLTAYAWVPPAGLVKDLPASKFKEVLENPEAVLWVDFESATAKEIALLRNPFGIAGLAVDECRDFTALPKVEDFGSYFLTILHRIQFDETTREMRLREIDFILGRNWLVTVREDSSTSVETVRKRIEAGPEILKEGPARIMCDVVQAITSRYFPMVEFLEQQVDRLEEEFFEDKGESDVFQRILQLRRSVVALRRSLVPQREVIHRLAREEFRQVMGTSAARMRNTHDELYWILTELEIHRELLTSAFEGHAAMASNRLAVLSNRMNMVMERLTRLSTVIMPLTLLTGIYGMNFDYMPELRWKWGYLVCLGLLAFTGAALTYYLRRVIPPLVIEEEKAPKVVKTRVYRKPPVPAT